MQVRNAIIIDGEVLNNTNVAAASLDVLQSLGLVLIDYNKHLVDKSQYDPFKKSDYYNMLSLLAKNNPESGYSADIEQGCLSLTGLGMQFVSVCI